MGALPLTLGTAGHVDHGKTTLVRHLTGTDTDRLPEERRRGLSIALGYARLELPSGRTLSVVDVPGHDRFVRTMVAGASGIDLFLMTVAADDGIMTQTREHATILRGLGVGAGVVAITKADRADPAPAAEAARRLLPGAEVVPVCAASGQGLPELRAALERTAGKLAPRAGLPGPARLHIDRVLSIHGAGTVVTGTLWRGSLGRGDLVAILPSRQSARVRSVEVHGQPAGRAQAGQRVAVCLPGVRRSQVSPGDVLCDPAAGLAPSFRVDVSAEGPLQLRGGERVMVHHGTRESPARAVPIGERAWQLRLESALIASAGDHVVLRRIAPPGTIGGAVVLDPAPRRHGAGARAEGRGPALAPGAARRAGPASHLDDSAQRLEDRLRAAGLPPLPEIEERLVACLRVRGSLSLAELRDELGTSRALALALLQHFDGRGLTLRRPDDRRVLRGRQGG